MEEQNELKQNEGIIIKKQKFIKYKIKKQKSLDQNQFLRKYQETVY